MTDRELLEKIAAQVGTLTNQVGTLTNQVDGLQNDIKGVQYEMQNMQNDIKGVQYEMQEGFREAYNERQEIITELKDVKKTVIKIEDEHGKKLSTLFDGYKQNSDVLERVEKEVSKHEEIILRRVQ